MENRNEIREGQYFGNTPTALPNSTAVLVLGIVSIVFCSCYGIIGVICGIISLVLFGKDKKLYVQNPQAYTPASYTNLKAGRVCALIGLILSALLIVVLTVWAIFFGMAFFANPDQFFNQIH